MEKKKKKVIKRGRPVTIDKLSRICLSLSETEKEKLQTLAKESDCQSVSHYVRKIIAGS